jgi:hypothetical protein
MSHPKDAEVVEFGWCVALGASELNVVLMCGWLGNGHLEWKNVRKRDRTWFVIFQRECLCGIGAAAVVWE